MNTRAWTVHPNRSEPGEDMPGTNGHFRAVSPAQPPTEAEAESMCLARIDLPDELAHHGSPDGTVTFSGYDWHFVVGVAHTFAQVYTDVEVPPAFGYRDRGTWTWWDGTTSVESILEGPDAQAYVQEFLERLFPDMSFTLVDNR